MPFVLMDDFSYCTIILSICFLIQPATATAIANGVLNLSCLSKETELRNIQVNSSSESSVLVTWDYPACEYNESDATTVPNLFLNQVDYLTLKYSPCRNETWPALVHDPATDVYLARYDVDESFYSWKTMNLSDVKSSLVPPTRMEVNVTKLLFPDWPYRFYLGGEINGSFYVFPEVSGRTYPSTPKVCPGCFRILWTRSHQGDRKIRVYWPHKVGQEVSFLLTVYTVYEGSSNDTMMTKVNEREISEDYHGYVDEVIGMWRYVFWFKELGPYARASLRESIIAVPEEQKMLKWVPSISTTIDSNINTKIRTLSWKKPKMVDVVKHYTLVWYDKKKWRENQYRSPIMDWIYIPGNLTSIKFKMVDSKEYDVGRVGLRLIANTEDSSSGLREFDG